MTGHKPLGKDGNQLFGLNPQVVPMRLGFTSYVITIPCRRKPRQVVIAFNIRVAAGQEERANFQPISERIAREFDRNTQELFFVDSFERSLRAFIDPNHVGLEPFKQNTERGSPFVLIYC